MLNVVLALLLFRLASSTIKCPDGKLCPDRSTCCDTDSGYECCPVPHAVCCPDRAHCCPKDYQCNTLTSMCERSGGRMPLLQKAPAKPTALSSLNVAALDPKMAEQGERCPVGFHRNKHQACVRGEGRKTVPQHTLSTGSQDLITYCDRKFFCPVNNTCCKNPSEQWACCPYPLGQCCPDKMHCCAFGYVCDRRSTGCVKRHSIFPAGSRRY